MTGADTIRWLIFATTLPGRSQSTPRVRLWRALRDLGAATMRDGVSLLPARGAHREKLETLGEQVEAEGGTAWLLELEAQRDETEARMRAAFHRADAYADFHGDLASLRSDLPRLDEATVRTRLRRLARELEAIVRIDFFPGDERAHAREALDELVGQVNQRFSPREPTPARREITPLDASRYQGRSWATRRRPWVDRVASAWLIRRFVDPAARFIWLEHPEDCPEDALGFDFDGATFTHVDERVTFEVLLASFGLESDPGLARLGRLVHYLDVGGEALAEAAGFEAVLAGLREATPDDDALLEAVAPVLDALHRRYTTVAA